ncbi:glycosyltransferase family 9 protein [Phycisphaeraceae bacterium D3-23]
MSGGEPPKPETPEHRTPERQALDPAPDASGERILIVRPTALGDVAKTVPCLATLRAAFPGARIDWLVHSAFADVVGYHPMLDGVVPFDRKGLSGFGLRPRATRAGLALAKRLRRAKYTRVYDLQGLARSGLLTWLTRSPKRVGFMYARERAGLGYNVKYPVAVAQHTVDRMLGLLEADGLSPVHDARLYVGEDDAAWARDYLETQRLSAGRYVCLAPTAQWGCKCWPAERYAELAQRVVAHVGVEDRVVILAAPHEHDRLTPITQALGDLALLPATTVGQLMGLIQAAAAVVANDSAALHLAVGLGRPAVGIFGPTDPKLVGPYRRGDDVVQPDGITADDMGDYRGRKDDDALIARVAVDAVWAKLEARLPA